MDIEIRVPTRDHVDAIFDVRAQAFGVKEDDRERGRYYRRFDDRGGVGAIWA